MRSRAHRIPVELEHGRLAKNWDEIVNNRSTTVTDDDQPPVPPCVSAEFVGGPPTIRQWAYDAASVEGVISMIIGIWIAQYGSPWTIRNRAIDRQFGVLVSQPTEVLAGFSFMIVGAVVLG